MPWSYGGKVYGGVVSPWVSHAYSVTCFCLFDGPGDNEELYVGDASGNIYQMDSGYASGMVVLTKDDDMGHPFDEKIVHGIAVVARSVSSSPGVIDLQFTLDQTLNTTITLTFPKTGDPDLSSKYTYFRVDTVGIYDIIQGFKIGLKIWPSVDAKHFAIQKIYMWGVLKPLNQQRE